MKFIVESSLIFLYKIKFFFLIKTLIFFFLIIQLIEKKVIKSYKYKYK